MLGLAVSSLLFDGRSASSEGDLTRVRAHLVREASLHQLALKLGLPDVMRLSEGEARDGGAQRPSILADAMEAVLGAAYLDGGYDAALGIVRQLLGATIAEAGATPTFARDPKTALQEWLQARRHACRNTASSPPVVVRMTRSSTSNAPSLPLKPPRLARAFAPQCRAGGGRAACWRA